MSKNPDQKKSSPLWGAPDNKTHQARPKRELKNPDIFFTLKVYSQASGRDHRSLKFTLDFNAPFQANVDDLEPYYVNPKDPNTLQLFRDILDHVGEVYKYVGDPENYRPDGTDFGITKDSTRHDQQKNLAKILELTQGRINHIFYEQGSANRVGVGAVALSDGNGDMRPPKKP